MTRNYKDTVRVPERRVRIKEDSARSSYDRESEHDLID
jgi:hypothetical protein